jgi:hypothetical protein
MYFQTFSKNLKQYYTFRLRLQNFQFLVVMSGYFLSVSSIRRISMRCFIATLFPLFLVSSLAFSEYHEIYTCQKGPKAIQYGISYKNVQGEPPCKLLEKYANSQAKQIGFSQKTKGVCEKGLEKILTRCQNQGMVCTKVENEPETKPEITPTNSPTIEPTPTPETK